MDPAAVNCNRVITQCLMLSVTACKSKFAGFTLISNPFEVGGQHQWVRRCLEEYPQYPNKCNIDNDAHQSDKTSERIEFAVPVNLRWVTLGYHYDWNTKVNGLS
jgi:hypothetical protein